jgi:hypothetical protein
LRFVMLLSFVLCVVQIISIHLLINLFFFVAFKKIKSHKILK